MEASQNSSKELKPCRICVDFYGTEDTDFLCSKCSREQAKQTQAAQQQTNELARLITESTATAPAQQAEPTQLPAQIATVAALSGAADE